MAREREKKMKNSFGETFDAFPMIYSSEVKNMTGCDTTLWKRIFQRGIQFACEENDLW